MIGFSRPDLDFVALSQGMGVQVTRARSGEEPAAQFTCGRRHARSPDH